MEGFLDVKYQSVNEMCFGWLPNPTATIKKREQWKRRYFVLQESVSNHLPGHHASLVYYKDSNRKEQKGTIDLEHCEEVLSSLDSQIYKYLFGIKTLYKKDASRTYFLAAKNEEEMERWVSSLCQVCNLKENEHDVVAEPPPPAAPPRPENTLPLLHPSRHTEDLTRRGTENTLPNTLPKLPPNRLEQPRLAPSHQNPDQEEYIPLETCVSGSHESDDVFSSIPLGYAPPVPPTPTKTGRSVDAILGFGKNADGQTYDHPSSFQRSQKNELDNNDNLYKLPPSSHPSVTDEGFTNVYKQPPAPRRVKEQDVFNLVPPPQNTDFINPNNANGQKKDDDDDEDDDVYKVPPSRPELVPELVEYDTPQSRAQIGHWNKNTTGSISHKVESINIADQEIYDTPPPTATGSMLDHIPPPPKPHDFGTADSRYINLPNNSKSQPSAVVSYDIPPSTTERSKYKSDAEMLAISPPPPTEHKKTVQVHRYTNAPAGFVPAATDGSYMPMTNPTPGSSINVLVPTDPLATQGSCDSSYLPMGNNHGDCYIPMEKRQDYLNMQQTGSPPNDSYSVGRQSSRKSTNSIYSVMPVGPPRRYNPEYDNLNDDVYTSHVSNRPVSEAEDVYNIPPSSRPVEPSPSTYVPAPSQRDETYSRPPPSRSQPAVPSRTMPNSLDSYASVERDSTYDTPPPKSQKYKQVPVAERAVPSFNVERSKSFKRNVSPPASEVLLPKRTSNSEDSSSSEEESESLSESKSSSSHDRSLDHIPRKSTPQIHSLTHVGNRSLHSTPPPPKKVGEIQYLDLDLTESQKCEKVGYDPEKSPAACAKSPGRSHTIPSSTEYREIDFIKTDALSATKREVESKRKSSEKSVDE